MLSMSTVSTAEAPASAPSDSQTTSRVWLFTFISSIVAWIIALLLIRSGSVVTLVIGTLIIGIGPVVGYALATDVSKSILGMILGALGYTLGVGVLSGITWPILTGAAIRNVSLLRLLLFSILGDIVGGLVVFAILAGMIGQDPNWLQTAFIVWGAIWSLAVSFAMAR